VDSNGNANACGYTDSNQDTFPVKASPDLTHNCGIHDAFVAKIKMITQPPLDLLLLE
jgi:hypothetical protein